MGCSRDLPHGENALSQTGLQFRQKSNGYRPSTAPELVSNSSSGDVSIALLYIYNSLNKFSLLKEKHVTYYFLQSIAAKSET